MIGKRIAAHILNKVIIFFPAMLLLGGGSLLIFRSYFIFGNDQGSGWLIFWVLRYMICLPTVESIFSLIRINPKSIPTDSIYTQTPQINNGIGLIENVVNNTLPIATAYASTNPIH